MSHEPASPRTESRPNYLYSGGNVLMHPPLSLGSSEMYGFFVKGKRSALQQTVDATLNAAADGRMSFKVLSPYVLLTFTDVQHANSTDPVDRAKGWGQETDIVTWVMVGQFLPGETKIHRIYFYPCHIWVNDCMALINGRELYGYPKYECQYTMPLAEGDPLTFSLACKGFQPFSPDTELAMHPLLQVAPEHPLPPPTPLQDFEALVRQAVALLASDADALDLSLAGWEQVIQTLLAPQIDQVFLKQFPDGAGVKAVYQAVVAAPARIDKIRAVKLFGGPFGCTLQPFASFPLDQTLGWALGTQPAILPFHVSMDFSVTPGVELVDNSVIQPQKVAIIGGGVGAMTTAFYLTDQPGWQNRYEITVYQMGWRIGGKGASGRNAAAGQRIEEHGLHIWFGFYENAFALMKRAYALLGRPAGAPLATWDEAFKPQHFVALTEWIRDHWEIWPVDTPPRPGTPGSGSERLSIWDVVVTACEWIQQWLGELGNAHAAPPPVASPGDPGWLHRLAEATQREAAHLAGDVRHAAAALHDAAKALGSDIARHDGADHEMLHASLQGLRGWLRDAWPAPGEISTDLRRLYICADLAITALIGMFEDHVFTQGFDVINDIDFQAWLAQHGANPGVTVDSAPVRGFYDLVFAFEDGDFHKPNIEAGTMLRGMMLVAFAYQGAIMWKMQAGMGDVVFTPFYQLLRQRGVTFKFFHQVDELLPSADGGNTVEQIVLTRQVDVTRGADHYEPLVDVKGLACWPSAPQYGQIVPAQAALLQAKNINLESHWSDWPDVYEAAFGKPLPHITLQRGVDFDLVVFGASAASVPELAPKLVERSPALQSMTAKVKTVATQAYQVWLTQDLKALGWNTWATNPAHADEEPVLSAFTEPFDTWAPMDQLLVREDWPPGQEPKNVSYFCSALPMAHYPPERDFGFPARCKAEVRVAATKQLNTEVGALWPSATTAEGFKWEWLVDLNGGVGEQRFASQYWRANVDPSERYVLSVVGSSAYRLATDGSGFTNLYLTGDWIRTGLNAGCVEAATMAGMQTARAICGWPAVIRGEAGW
ncbi:NAD(P)-binding protein [Ideonella sp.]|uniref:NAD(P)-binding protein n=1 Tax=Ideonella sp. TaxID=1929293 RepID=UPI002B478399|nr:NAD(P)-binding protein [Ideonella sp.]HJV70703.1 NAD(P)-binding protein [Ideonella sp.]